MTLDEWHRQQRAHVHALYDAAHVQLQQRRREELARLEEAVLQIARDMAAQMRDGEQNS